MRSQPEHPVKKKKSITPSVKTACRTVPGRNVAPPEENEVQRRHGHHSTPKNTTATTTKDTSRRVNGHTEECRHVSQKANDQLFLFSNPRSQNKRRPVPYCQNNGDTARHKKQQSLYVGATNGIDVPSPWAGEGGKDVSFRASGASMPFGGSVSCRDQARRWSCFGGCRRITDLKTQPLS